MKLSSMLNVVLHKMFFFLECRLKAQGPSNREDAKAMIEPVLDALFLR